MLVVRPRQSCTGIRRNIGKPFLKTVPAPADSSKLNVAYVISRPLAMPYVDNPVSWARLAYSLVYMFQHDSHVAITWFVPQNTAIAGYTTNCLSDYNVFFKDTFSTDNRYYAEFLTELSKQYDIVIDDSGNYLMARTSAYKNTLPVTVLSLGHLDNIRQSGFIIYNHALNVTDGRRLTNNPVVYHGHIDSHNSVVFEYPTQQGYWISCGVLGQNKNQRDAMLLSLKFDKPLVMCGFSYHDLVSQSRKPYIKQLLGLTEQLNARDLITFTGIIKDRLAVMKLIRGADALLFTSYSEAFNLPLVESWTMGTPVLSFPYFTKIIDGCSAVERGWAKILPTPDIECLTEKDVEISHYDVEEAKQIFSVDKWKQRYVDLFTVLSCTKSLQKTYQHIDAQDYGCPMLKSSVYHPQNLKL